MMLEPKLLTSLAATLLLAVACRSLPPASPETAATSLLGEPLTAPRLPADFRAEQEALLAEARAEHVANPDDLEALIWVGRRTAYLGRYREAIDIYSRGIAARPRYAALYRHRGHRYLTVREIDRAIADFERAATLIAGQPDAVEPDGLPNARNLPRSTSHSNIWYHLGLAYYLRGDFDHALDAYRQALEFSTNADMLSATSHWLYMTLRRLGREAEAREVLAPIHGDMDIIENDAYHRLLMMYKGEEDAEELLAEVRSVAGDLESATLGYGLGNWFLYNGDEERAKSIFRQIVAGASWAAFGYLAAEAELARDQSAP